MSQPKKLAELYSGKAKTLYTTDDPNSLVMLFRNDTSAFDGKRIEQLAGKGRVNNLFNAHIMKLLEQSGIRTGFIKTLSDTESLVKKLAMLPIECVIRNYAAGGLVRRYSISANMELAPPMCEFFLKDDANSDPLITKENIIRFGFASQQDLALIQEYSLEANKILTEFFSSNGLILVDFKLEFGKANNKLYLGDEFTPDGCRIWDKATKQVYDKDLFRKNMGDVVFGYSIAAEKLGINL